MERNYNALEYDNGEEVDGDEVIESSHEADSGLHFYEESEISWSYDDNKK
jgi:hypothetical protein